MRSAFASIAAAVSIRALPVKGERYLITFRAIVAKLFQSALSP